MKCSVIASLLWPASLTVADIIYIAPSAKTGGTMLSGFCTMTEIKWSEVYYA